MSRECNRALMVSWALAIGVMTLLAIQQYGMLGLACMGSLLSTGALLVSLIRTHSCLASASNDVEQQQDGTGGEEDDSPPSYEVVTSKPPPYSLLFSQPQETAYWDMEHLRNHKNTVQLWTVEEQETSPPSFAQAVRFEVGDFGTSMAVPTEDTLPGSWGAASSTASSEVIDPSIPSSTAPSAPSTESADAAALTTESTAYITPSSCSTHVGHLSTEVTPTLPPPRCQHMHTLGEGA